MKNNNKIKHKRKHNKFIVTPCFKINLHRLPIVMLPVEYLLNLVLLARLFTDRLESIIVLFELQILKTRQRVIRGGQDGNREELINLVEMALLHANVGDDLDETDVLGEVLQLPQRVLEDLETRMVFGRFGQSLCIDLVKDVK